MPEQVRKYMFEQHTSANLSLHTVFLRATATISWPSRPNLPKILKHSHRLHAGLRRWTPFSLTEDRRHYDHLLSTQKTMMNSPPEEGFLPPTPEAHSDHQPSQIHQSPPWNQSEDRVLPSVPAPLHSQMTYQPRRNPIRPGRPPQSNTDHLVLLTDIVHHGRLPDDYQLTSALVPIELKPDDMTDIWVTSSNHCPESGLACFL
jgi:hypothetical protein